MSSEIAAMEKKTMRQLRMIVTTSARVFRISLPTFSTCTSPMPLCARARIRTASSSASTLFSGSAALAIT